MSLPAPGRPTQGRPPLIVGVIINGSGNVSFDVSANFFVYGNVNVNVFRCFALLVLCSYKTSFPSCEL